MEKSRGGGGAVRFDSELSRVLRQEYTRHEELCAQGARKQSEEGKKGGAAGHGALLEGYLENYHEGHYDQLLVAMGEPPRHTSVRIRGGGGGAAIGECETGRGVGGGGELQGLIAGMSRREDIGLVRNSGPYFDWNGKPIVSGSRDGMDHEWDRRLRKWEADGRKEVVITLNAGYSLLRGADLYCPGVMGCHPLMQKGDFVKVVADVEGKCNKGRIKPFEEGEGETMFVGYGTAQVSRDELFRPEARGDGFGTKGVGEEDSSNRGSGVPLSSGLAVELTFPQYRAPSLNGQLVDTIFPQNIPSIMCARSVAPERGDVVLDMCAAPGGKTCHLAELMIAAGEDGLLVAFDRSPKKIDKILTNLKNFGIEAESGPRNSASVKMSVSNPENLNVFVFAMDGTKCVNEDALSVGNSDSDGSNDRNERKKFVLQAVHEYRTKLGCKGTSTQKKKKPLLQFPKGSFDRVLLDGPCSALGQRPRLLFDMSVKTLETHPVYQKKLFTRAVELLRPGGVLVYSTCTLYAGENEDVVKWALETFPCLDLVESRPGRCGDAGSSSGHLSGNEIYYDNSMRDDLGDIVMLEGSYGLRGRGLEEAQRKLVQRWDPVACPSAIGFFVAKPHYRNVIRDVAVELKCVLGYRHCDGVSRERELFREEQRGSTQFDSDGIPPGDYKFPFLFRLPADLPSSIRVFHQNLDSLFFGKINYEVRAHVIHHKDPTLRRKVMRTGYRFRKRNIVQPTTDPEKLPITEKCKTFLLCKKEQPLRATVRLDKDVYRRGESVRVTVDVDNQSDKTVKWVEAAIFQRISYGVATGVGRRETTMVRKRLVESVRTCGNLKGVEAGKNCKKEFVVRIGSDTETDGEAPRHCAEELDGSVKVKRVPVLRKNLAVDSLSNLAPSLSNTSEHGSAHLEYFVKVRCHVGGLGTDLIVNVPFLVTDDVSVHCTSEEPRMSAGSETCGFDSQNASSDELPEYSEWFDLCEERPSAMHGKCTYNVSAHSGSHHSSSSAFSSTLTSLNSSTASLPALPLYENYPSDSLHTQAVSSINPELPNYVQALSYPIVN
eukprot:Nk52_evm28s233 gene=Nk52_evmTU28s233